MQASKLATVLILAVLPTLLSLGCDRKDDAPPPPAPPSAAPVAPPPQAVAPPPGTPIGQVPQQPAVAVKPGVKPAASAAQVAKADGGAVVALPSAVPVALPQIPTIPAMPSPSAIGAAASAIAGGLAPLIPPPPKTGDR